MIGRITAKALVGVAALVLAGCGGNSLIRADDAPSLETPLPDARVMEHWQTRVGAASVPYHRLELARIEDRLFAASSNGEVAAFDADTGESRWRQSLDVEIAGAVGAGDNLVAVGTADAELLVLDAETGDPAWRTRVSSEVLAPPAVGQGSVVVRTADGGVFALDAADGEQRWLYRRNVPALSLQGHSAPVLVNNGVVAGFDNGRLSALDLVTGNPVWEATVAVPEGRTDLERMVDLDADPVVRGRDLFAGTYQGRLAGLALSDGQVNWAREVSVLGGLSVDENNLYATDDAGRVWAFDRRNGASVWRLDALADIRLTAPVRYDDELVVGGSDGRLYWIDIRDGRLTARYEVGSNAIAAPPLVDEDKLYVLDLGGRLRALTIEQGN